MQEDFYFNNFIKFAICLDSRLPSSVSSYFPNKPHTHTHTHTLFWHSNINKPERKNFVFKITQLPEVEIQQSYELL